MASGSPESSQRGKKERKFYADLTQAEKVFLSGSSQTQSLLTSWQCVASGVSILLPDENVSKETLLAVLVPRQVSFLTLNILLNSDLWVQGREQATHRHCGCLPPA